MRLKSLMALAVAIVSLGMVAAPEPASAFGWDRPDQSIRWSRYASDDVADPYAYRYIPRGYYPYYNSHYWRKVRVKRFRGHLPPYYAAWGAPRRGYYHVEWHRQHYGGHHRGDW